MLPPSTLLATDFVLGELNRRFQMDKHDGKYPTMWCGVSQLSTEGEPLGMFDAAVCRVHAYTVPPDCRILIYSDGAFEFAQGDGRSLSLADLNTLFTRLAESPVDDLVETLRSLTSAGHFDDDCTLVKLEFD